MKLRRLDWLAAAALVAFLGAPVAHAADDHAADEKLTMEQAKKLKNPLPYTRKSIAEGKQTFLGNCTGCHGENGKAEGAIIADATDLTSPSLYKYGTSDGEIYRSIHDGAGDQMLAFKYQISEDEKFWQLVNFIRSLWPESMRPPLQEDKKQ